MTYFFGNMLFTFDFSKYENNLEENIKTFIIVFVTGSGLVIENLLTGTVILHLERDDKDIRNKLEQDLLLSKIS